MKYKASSVKNYIPYKARLSVLVKKNDELCQTEPVLKKLEQLLLEYGGDFVSLVYDEDSNKILERGLLYEAGKYQVKIIKGLTNQCHKNAIRLWKEKPEQYQMFTGYYLLKDIDGLFYWRMHSWVLDVKTNQIIETTKKALFYFGFPLNNEECNDFYYYNI